jgi:hypothetical protein
MVVLIKFYCPEILRKQLANNFIIQSLVNKSRAHDYLIYNIWVCYGLTNANILLELHIIIWIYLTFQNCLFLSFRPLMENMSESFFSHFRN